MKISSWLFGLQKLYQTKINSQLGQHPKTNNNNLIFSQAKSQIEEKNIEILNRTIMQLKIKKGR